MPEQIVLVRHGQTEWSRVGRHTGRTDIGLTDQGENEARLVTGTLAEWNFDAAFSSPLLRARDTARLAGFSPTLDDDLVEWDYGAIEGRTNDEITAERPGWSKWIDGPPGGERADDVGVRADRFLERIAAVGGEVVVFAHGHFLSIAIARWLGLPASEGRRFPLRTATVSVLGAKRDDHVLTLFNHLCGHGLVDPELPAEALR
ncbi:MAG: histidine phosphatase family protein [Actinomycetota bacterium]